MIKIGSIITIGEIHAESWDYLEWVGYTATITRYIGYDLCTVELEDYPELIIGIHTDDCIKFIN